MRINSKSVLSNAYYHIKPFMPRWLQIELRRKVILRKRLKYPDVWPINKEAAKPSERWSGWPYGKRFALVLTHDVDSAKGVDRCTQLAMLEEGMGFRSSFNFVAEEYKVSVSLRKDLRDLGFEVGVHGIRHSGNLFKSKTHFHEQAVKINQCLKEWGSVGFRSPSMYHNLDWIGELDIEYDCSTFDTDPFEPQPDGMGTIFPFWVPSNSPSNSSNPINSSNLELLSSNLVPHTALANGYVELPYTLPQDFTLFVLMKEKTIDIWKRKLDWIAEKGGMALLLTHPDYMNFDGKKLGIEEYPASYYEEFLKYIKHKYEGQFWHVLPKDMARFWSKRHRENALMENT
jgi:hypothetical protein